MAEIAQLGFGVSTSQLDQALPALRALVPAAKAVETGANNAAAAIDNVGAAAAGTATATAAAVRVINTAATGMSTVAANTNKATEAYNKFADIQNKINKATGVTVASPVGRADDIAAYGQAMDALRAKYNPLFAASQSYKATLSEINMALKTGALNEKEHAAAIMNTKVAFTSQVNAIRGVTEMENAHVGATGKVGKAYQGLSNDAKNLSYQLVDVGQGVLSGQPLFMIMAQQLGQIGQVAATAEGGLKGLLSEIGSKIASALTPVRLLAIGFLALGAAMLFSVTSTISSSRALDDLSKSIDVSTTKLHGLQQAAGFKGISTDEFAQGMTQFAASVDDAQHNVGSLKGLMIASGKSAKDLEGYLLNVADIMAQTTSGVQKRNLLEAAGLPTTQSWVRLMSQGRKGIQDAIAESVKFNTSAEANLVQKARDFDDAWNKATTKMGQYFKSSVVEAMGWIDQLNKSTLTIAAGLGAALAIALAPFSLIAATLLAVAAAISAAAAYSKSSSPSEADGGPKRIRIQASATDAAANPKQDQKTQAQLLTENTQAQQRISILGDMATVEQRVTATRLQLNAAGLQGVGVSDQMAKKIENNVRAQEEQNRVNQQASIGVFNLSAAQKAASDTLQSWIDKGLVDKNNAEQMAAAHLVLARNIKATSDAAAVAAAPLQQLKQLELDGGNLAKNLDTAVTGSLNNMVQPIQDMMNGVTGLGAGFKNLGVVVLQAIQQMIIKMLILTPIAKALQAVMGGMFGFADGGIPGASGPTSLGGAPLVKNALGGVYNSPSLSSFSGQIVKQPTMFKFASGAGLMGEAGPEGILPLRRGPSGALGVQMFGQQSSNDNAAPSVVYAPANTFHLGGSVTQADLDKVKKIQDDDRQQFGANMTKSLMNMRVHNRRI